MNHRLFTQQDFVTRAERCDNPRERAMWQQAAVSDELVNHLGQIILTAAKHMGMVLEAEQQTLQMIQNDLTFRETNHEP